MRRRGWTKAQITNIEFFENEVAGFAVDLTLTEPARERELPEVHVNVALVEGARMTMENRIVSQRRTRKIAEVASIKTLSGRIQAIARTALKSIISRAVHTPVAIEKGNYSKNITDPKRQKRLKLLFDSLHLETPNLERKKEVSRLKLKTLYSKLSSATLALISMPSKRQVLERSRRQSRL